MLAGTASAQSDSITVGNQTLTINGLWRHFNDSIATPPIYLIVGADTLDRQMIKANITGTGKTMTLYAHDQLSDLSKLQDHGDLINSLQINEELPLYRYTNRSNVLVYITKGVYYGILRRLDALERKK